MTADELEALLEGALETDTLEFKGAMLWSKSLIKDILAMSNLSSGGRIVIGIEDTTLIRQGLLEEQIASFNIDIMKDQVGNYADPMAIFRNDVVEDRAGLKLVVISVSPFEWLPVICRKNGDGMFAGVIYYRTRTRRPQSAAVSTSNDMLDIVLRAAANTHSRLAIHGYRPDTKTVEVLDLELGGL